MGQVEAQATGTGPTDPFEQRVLNSQGGVSNQPHSSHNGRRIFRADEFYWFRFLLQGAEANGTFFAG
jgi:hypothetical protein